MSIDPSDRNDGARVGASHLLARAAADDVRADHHVMAAIDDFFIPDEARLDDRVRSALSESLRDIIGAVEREIRQFASRLLIGVDEPVAANRLISSPASAFEALSNAGLLRDADLMRELLARVRQELLSDALPTATPDDPERPSLLSRLVSHPDGVVASAASAMMAADSRRLGTTPGAAMRSDLPAELHHRVVWWVAAALREQLGEDAVPAADRALADAAMRSLAAHDEGDRFEAAAMRLATAIAPQPNELPAYLIESLGDRRLALFIALLAQALGCGYDVAREMVLDPVADRLWSALRCLDLDRPVIARIGLALCEGDPRRNVELFADQLDAIMAIEPEAARAALAIVQMPSDFRFALLQLRKAKQA